MISQPMRGMTDNEILKTRDEIAYSLEQRGYEVVNSFFPIEVEKDEEVINPPVNLLSKAVEAMSRCDAVFFAPGWWNARGCRIEHEIAENYGIEIIE